MINCYGCLKERGLKKTKISFLKYKCLLAQKWTIKAFKMFKLKGLGDLVLELNEVFNVYCSN